MYSQSVIVVFRSIAVNTKVRLETSHRNVVNWLYDFLINRQQRVITTTTSESLTTSTGSPKGCVLSPFVFSLYVADMPIVSDSIQVIKYADDTVLIEFLSEHQPFALQSEADNFYRCCTENNLLLNVKQAKELIFSNTRDNPMAPELIINHNTIEQVEEFTYLGTILTTKLVFSANTVKTVRKARSRLYIMTKLYHLGVNNSLISTCYKSFIQSVLT